MSHCPYCEHTRRFHEEPVECPGCPDCAKKNTEIQALQATLEEVERELLAMRDEARLQTNLKIDCTFALASAHEDVRALARGCLLDRNTRWSVDKDFEGDWVVIPLSDFKRARTALSRPTVRSIMEKSDD